MKLELEQNNSEYLINRYEPGTIYINNEPYSNSLILSQNELITDWAVTEVSQLTIDSLGSALKIKPQILLIGTGQKAAFLAPELLVNIQKQRIGVEVMDTQAACRTYNIVVGEGRLCAAAFIMD